MTTAKSETFEAGSMASSCWGSSSWRGTRLRLPGVPMCVDHAGRHDVPRDVHRLRLVDGEVRCHRGDHTVLDQHVTSGQVPQTRIHGEDGAAAQHNAMPSHDDSFVIRATEAVPPVDSPHQRSTPGIISLNGCEPAVTEVLTARTPLT
ncbi:hypothetical protein AQJ58_20530 [Streptomyces sp. DSM 15324]|nr:hypothetical protein AQJ58_20530 [Streptomyces sp. DSM 15324]